MLDPCVRVCVRACVPKRMRVDTKLVYSYSALSSLNLSIRGRETFTVTLIVLCGVGWKIVIDDPLCVPLRPSDTGWSVGR